jgi:uncharacterized membrane protein YsdA (DUF1294 family)
VPWWLVGWLGFMTVATFVAYAVDKRAARSGARRIPERTLFALNLAGGFIGGWLGMWLLHHKTLHTSFRLVQTAATVLWLVVIALLATDGLVS